jgi:hypothetical protein
LKRPSQAASNCSFPSLGLPVNVTPLMMASQVFGDQPKVLMMITVTVILILITLLPASYWFDRKAITAFLCRNGP